jgi:stage II sporulation protein GA (sporulation sigma-E factor processing peptidase)
MIRRRAPKNQIYRLTVMHKGKTVVCDCLYDSGCTLREPFSGKPTVVMEKGAASSFSVYLQHENTENATGGSLRFIPFRSLGGKGLLPAFLPERMAVSDGEKERDITGCYLAVSERLTSGEYVALMGTDIGDLLAEGR